MRKGYKVITSLSNPIIKEAIRFKKYPDKKHNFFLIEGYHLIDSAISSPLVQIERLFFTEDFVAMEKSKKLLSLLSEIENILVSSKILKALTDTESPQGIVAVVNYRSIRLEELKFRKDLLLLLCDAIQDPGNLGTIIRVATAFNVDAVILLPFSCSPFNPKALRATSGGIFYTPIVFAEHEEILKFLQNENIPLFVASSKAKRSIYEIRFRKPLAIIVGNEARGVTRIFQDFAKDTFKIPMSGKMESLNVAMATSISLYEIARQRYLVQN